MTKVSPEYDSEGRPEDGSPLIDSSLIESPPRRRRRRSQLPLATHINEPRAPRKIHRTRRERLIGGVCGGIAREYQLDPSLVRALTVLASFVGGAGIIGYLAALFLLPLEPRAWAVARPEGAPRQDSALVWAGLVLVTAGLLFLAWIPAFQFRLFTPGWGALWPGLLITLALAVLITRRRDPAARDEIAARWLSRPRHDRMLLGVASGFARYTGIDANLVRLAFAVILLWSYGVGALLYLALAVFLPLDSNRE